MPGISLTCHLGWNPLVLDALGSTSLVSDVLPHLGREDFQLASWGTVHGSQTSETYTSQKACPLPYVWWRLKLGVQVQRGNHLPQHSQGKCPIPSSFSELLRRDPEFIWIPNPLYMTWVLSLETSSLCPVFRSSTLLYLSGVYFYCSPLSRHFKLDACVLQFWKVFLKDFFDCFLLNIFSAF